MAVLFQACTSSFLWRGINRVATKQLKKDSGLKLKGTYNRKLHSPVILKQNSLTISLYKNKSISTIPSSATPINLSFRHISICLRIPIITTKERHNRKPFCLYFRLGQRKQLKQFSRLVLHLSAFLKVPNGLRGTGLDQLVWSKVKSGLMVEIRPTGQSGLLDPT